MVVTGGGSLSGCMRLGDQAAPTAYSLHCVPPGAPNLCGVHAAPCLSEVEVTVETSVIVHYLGTL